MTLCNIINFLYRLQFSTQQYKVTDRASRCLLCVAIYNCLFTAVGSDEEVTEGLEEGVEEMDADWTYTNYDDAIYCWH